ncbi:DEAD/DEAH box helicase family protein [Streptomyces halstedii]|uniref:DEAD/DEAH box helicase family protein n=1 Tax=Streptomyces halstedii TaxID=1944 RepID=UPI003683EF0E
MTPSGAPVQGHGSLALPTGAGKTLVGGLIAEYLRRAEGSRVAYLCPTRQLAAQTARKAADRGGDLGRRSCAGSGCAPWWTGSGAYTRRGRRRTRTRPARHFQPAGWSRSRSGS